VATYTPAKTVAYETLVGCAAALAMAGRAPSAAPIALQVALELEIPASWSKTRRAQAAAGSIRATAKPDADNVLKAIKDGCNGVVWIDDAQVVRIMVEKRYAAVPCALVKVVELAGAPAARLRPPTVQQQ
jgi:Holliday junction resolvase RusA-like endonuclease